jgi:hypothetical protein
VGYQAVVTEENESSDTQQQQTFCLQNQLVVNGPKRPHHNSNTNPQQAKSTLLLHLPKRQQV